VATFLLSDVMRGSPARFRSLDGLEDEASPNQQRQFILDWKWRWFGSVLSFCDIILNIEQDTTKPNTTKQI
jgi:hypothetical protein